MNILFITHYFSPHIGGVETHLSELSKKLKVKNQKITIFTEKYHQKLKKEEIMNGIKVVRFSYPHIKFLGIFYIWWQLFKNRKLIKIADIVHIHDVFVWYLPFRLLYINKKVFTTIHGLEWDDPMSLSGYWQKKIACKLSNGTIGVGKFLESYLQLKFSVIIYGATKPGISKGKNKSILYLGRLEENTGLLNFIKWLKDNQKYRVIFCGDGSLRAVCEKNGRVVGFTNPIPYLKKAEYCVPGGYLAALEALAYGCKLKLFWNNKVKEDYWKMSPFYKLKSKKLKEWASTQTWEKLTKEYIDLYN